MFLYTRNENRDIDIITNPIIGTTYVVNRKPHRVRPRAINIQGR